jgi:hypothetical protein
MASAGEIGTKAMTVATDTSPIASLITPAGEQHGITFTKWPVSHSAMKAPNSQKASGNGLLRRRVMQNERNRDAGRPDQCIQSREGRDERPSHARRPCGAQTRRVEHPL